MDDLSERDLSGVPDEDLTPEERQELQRRIDEFVERMQFCRLEKPGKAVKPKTAPKAKRLMSWNPPSIARRH